MDSGRARDKVNPDAHPGAGSGPPVTMDIKRLEQVIPHRYPFLLIDRIVDVIAGESATGVKNVSINEWYFQGHFPGHPVMPGVLIIESMAQTAGALVVHTLGPEAEGKLVYFMSIADARFRKPVVPGDVLRLVVKKAHERGNVWRFDAKGFVGDQVVAEATFTAMILDR